MDTHLSVQNLAGCDQKQGPTVAIAPLGTPSTLAGPHGEGVTAYDGITGCT